MARFVQKIRMRKLCGVMLIVLLTAAYLFSTATYAQELELKDTKSFLTSGSAYSPDYLSYGDIWAFDEATFNVSNYRGYSGEPTSYSYYTSTDKTSSPSSSLQDITYWSTLKFTSHNAVTGTQVSKLTHSTLISGVEQKSQLSPVQSTQTIPTLTTDSNATYTVIPNSTGIYRVYVYSAEEAPGLNYFLIDSSDDNNNFANNSAEFGKVDLENITGTNWYYGDVEINLLGWAAYQPYGEKISNGVSSPTSDTVTVDGNSGSLGEEYTPATISDSTLGGGGSSYYYTMWTATSVRFNTLLVLQWDSTVELGPISKVGNTLTITTDSNTTDTNTGTVTVQNIFGETITADSTAQTVAQAPLFFTVEASEGSVFTGSEGASMTKVADGVYRYDYEQTSTLSFQWSEAESFPTVTLSGNSASGTIDFLAQKNISASYTIGAAGDYTITADFTNAEDNSINYSVYFGGKPENGGSLQTSGTLTVAEPSFTITPAMDNIYVSLSPATSTTGTIPVGEISISAMPDTSLPMVAHNITTDKKYAYIEDALLEAVSGNTVVLIADASFKTADEGQRLSWTTNNAGYTVKAGVTLLLPYAEGATTIQSSTGNNSFIHANVQFTKGNTPSLNPEDNYLKYTLTIPAGVSVSIADGNDSTYGRIVIGGTLSSIDGTLQYTGGTSSGAGMTHSNLKVNGTLKLGDYSILSVAGYLIGDGSVITEGSNATIYEPMLITDWRGAGAAILFMDTSLDKKVTIQSGENDIAPYIHWGVTNIRADLTITSGNYLKLYAHLREEDDAYCDTPTLVGSSSNNGLLVLSDGASLTSKYKPISWGTGKGYVFPGRYEIDISNGASLGSMSLKVSLQIGSVDVNTATQTFGIPYVFSLNLTDGTYNVDNGLSLMPGAELTVEETATLNVGTAPSTEYFRFFVFDGMLHRGRQQTYTDDSSSKWEIAYASSRYDTYNYPTAAELQNAGLSGDGELTVNGTLVIGGSASFGGLIQTDGSGTVDAMNGSAGEIPSATVQVGVVGNESQWYIIRTYYRHYAGMSLHTGTARILVNGVETDIVRGNTYYANKDENINTSFDFTYYGKSDLSAASIQKINYSLANTSLGIFGETIRGEWCTKQHTIGVLEAIPAKEATCSETGNHAYYKCTACGKCYTAGENNVLTETTEAAQAIATKPHTITDENHTVRVEPKCEVAGNVEYWTCSVCSWNFSDAQGTTKLDSVVIAALEHVPSENYSSNGTNHWYVCTLCNKELDVTAHTSATKEENRIDATCTEAGSYEHVTYCSVCSYEISRETIEISALGHNYTSEVTISPTCSTPGERTYTCTRDGHSYTEEIAIDPDAHSFTLASDEKVTDATCTEAATYYAKCALCKAVSDTVTLPVGDPLGHSYADPVVEFSDDYTTYTVTVTCTVCADGTTGHTATSETRQSTDTPPADCQHNVITYTASGTFENVSYSDFRTTTGDYGAHKPIKIDQKAPTCSAEGNNAYWYCEVEGCGKYFSDEACTTPTTVEKQILQIDADAHSYDAGSTTTAPTCTSAGVKTYTCLYNSEHTKTETVAALGHSFTSESHEATCTAPAYTVYTCSRNCGYSYTEAGALAEHTYDAGVCSACGATEPTVTFTVAHNLNLLDLVQIGYWVKAEASGDMQIAEDATYGILVWDNPADVGKEGTAKEYSLEKRGGYYFAYPFGEKEGILAQELDTVYYARPYVVIGGETYYSGTIDVYAAPMYAADLFASADYSTENQVHVVVRDLMNYATNAQFYFLVRNQGYTEETLKARTAINSVLPAQLRTTRYDATTMPLGEVPTVNAEGTLTCTWGKSTINLEEAISLNLHASVTGATTMLYWNDVDYANAGGTLDTNTKTGSAELTSATIQLDDDSYVSGMRGKIKDIYAKDIWDWYYGRMYDDANYSTVKADSVAAYLTRGIEKTLGSKQIADLDTEKQYLVKTCQDMLAYGKSALAYAQSINADATMEGE